MKYFLHVTNGMYAGLRTTMLDMETRYGTDMAPFYAMRALGVLVPQGASEIEIVVQKEKPHPFPMLVRADLAAHKCAKSASDMTDNDLQPPDTTR